MTEIEDEYNMDRKKLIQACMYHLIPFLYYLQHLFLILIMRTSVGSKEEKMLLLYFIIIYFKL
jgi:hypothetical protein